MLHNKGVPTWHVFFLPSCGNAVGKGLVVGLCIEYMFAENEEGVLFCVKKNLFWIGGGK